jgi:hypothetical protein
MKKTLDEILTGISADILGIETLEERNSDSLDFHEVSVWSIKRALEAAYKTGAAKEEWIDATQQHPNHDLPVLCACTDKEADSIAWIQWHEFGCYSHGSWWKADADIMNPVRLKVTHWMRKPDLPIIPARWGEEAQS